VVYYHFWYYSTFFSGSFSPSLPRERSPIQTMNAWRLSSAPLEKLHSDPKNHSFSNRIGDRTGEAVGSMVQWSNRSEPVEPPVR
jgi:hypothetical protein